MNTKAAYNLKASLKDLDIKQGIVVGYASHINSKDADGDIIMPGAFTKTLSENGSRIKHLLNHNISQPIGVPQVLKEDNNGLYYESKIGSHALGVDFLKMVDSGLITEHSIGFATIKQQQSKEKGANLITEVKLWEFSSLTAWGANENTPLLGVKALQSVSERIEKLKAAITNGTFTDASFGLLIDELNFLQKAYNEAITKPELKQESTLPNDYMKALQSFKQTIK